VKKLAILGVVLLVIWLVVGYLATNTVVGNHVDWRRLKAVPQDYGLRGDRVFCVSKDGLVLTAWWLPASGSARATVILAHGRDGNRSDMLPRANFLVRNGYNALALDLRAHGESEGGYLTPGYLEALDILGAVTYLRQQGERKPIVVLGHSYGAVAVLHAAAADPSLAAVIADSPFLSVADMMARARQFVLNDPHSSLGAKVGLWFAAAPLLADSTRFFYRLRTGLDFNEGQADVLPAIKGRKRPPFLFLAGDRDPIAVPENTRRMYEAVRSPIKAFALLPNAGHNTYRAAPKEYEAAVLDFLTRALPRP